MSLTLGELLSTVPAPKIDYRDCGADTVVTGVGWGNRLAPQPTPWVRITQ